MTEKPFVHKRALANVKANFIFQEEIADIIFKIINKKGILNIGRNQFYYWLLLIIENGYILMLEIKFLPE
jgi:hypothetical protein